MGGCGQRLPSRTALCHLHGSFKQVNDTYGHTFGDQCLQTIARLMRRAYGSAGQCFRTGGDEFAVMVTKHRDEVDEHALTFERLLQGERTADPRLPGVSIGIARAESGDDLQTAINEADKSMYAAKRNGRPA